MNQLIRCVSGTNLNLFRYTAMVVVLLMLGIGNAWANSHSTHYGKAVLNNATGNGTVYLSTSSSSNSGQTGTTGTAGAVGSTSYITWNCGGSSGNDSKTYYARGTANDGYYFAGYATSSTATSYTASTTGWSPTKASSTSSGSPTTSTIYGFFKPVTVTAAPSNVNINATDPLATYPDAGGAVLSFTTANSNKIGDFTTEASGDARWNISAWTRASASSTTFNYKFVGNGSYGETDRTFTKTVTLTSKGDASSTRSCTLTAKYPNPKVVSGDDSDEYTNIFTAFAAVGDQEAVTKTAVFDVVYADDGNNFTAAFSSITGGGAWNVTEITVDQNNQRATVTYTFNGNKAEGTHTALLTLTAKDCNGWNDGEAAGGASASVAITVTNEQEATNDVSVTTAGGVTTEYATWAAGLTAANASAGSTLKLLRDVDLTGTYGITGTQGITQTMTLDLNGKTLSGAINGSILNPKTAGKTLTIKDSKTGGKIQNITPDYNGVTYGVNISAGSVILESGTIHAENNAVFNHSTLTGLGTRAVKLAANSTFEMKGGMLEAVGGREVYGIYQESSSANNTADKSVVTIKGGTIRAEAPACVYGIRSYGKVNMSDGTIDVIVNTGTVNSNATYVASNFNDNTLHHYGYGIRMYGSASATTASNYSGTLTITGGTINVTNQNKTMNGTTMYNEHIYGVYMDVSVTGAGAGKTAPDGTKVQKACAVGSIENATINLNHAGVLGYGVFATGCYNSYNNTYTPLQIKNSTINVTTFQTAYGVYANAYINWNSTLTKLTGNGGCTYGDIELTNVTINATTTGGTGAYCAWATCTSGTVAKAKAETGSTSEGNATYYGEYAVAGKITVNSGTFTADAKTSSAYGIGSSDRAKCVRNVNGVFSGRDATTDPQGSLSNNTETSEAYPELYIHGGNFSATTGTTTAIAVKSGGNTLIDGGTFNAYAGGSTAYGLYVTAGKTTANGVTFPASATTVAYGVYVYGGISDWSLFPYAGEVELNNCNATATARTTTDARAVYVNGTTKVYTQASFDAMKTANNSNYQSYGDYAQVGERAFVGKATINGGTYSATAETTTAFGIYMMSTRVSTNKEAIAYNPLVVKNATIAAKTNTSTSAYGVSIGGGGLIENCTITATAGTTTASGVRAIDKTTVIKNSTISAKGTDVVYGLEGYVEASTAHGYCWHGDFDLSEAGTTKVTAESTASSKTAYTIYLNAKAVNIASGNFAGDYATAANATINGGTYIAKTNGGTSGYTLALTATQTKGSASAQPEVLIEGGKFNGATAEVGTAGVVGHVQLKGGYYVHNTNLSKYVPEGYEEVPLPNDRPEYTEGYRYVIEPEGNHGIYVCQIGNTKYKSLEEALQVVTSGQTILMIANYVMVEPGDYVLPAGATLLVPRSGQTTAQGTTIASGLRSNTRVAPSANLTLTFGNGVNLAVFGTIETGGLENDGGGGAQTGCTHGSYGRIILRSGAHIDLESGAKLQCWGYITGDGTITAKSGSQVYEYFEIAVCKGGTILSGMIGNSRDVFPLDDYFYQNIESEITYKPGCQAFASSGMYIQGNRPANSVKIVGNTTSHLFCMSTDGSRPNMWVKKKYDPTTDRCTWTLNDGAQLSSINITISGYGMNSSDYVLPIASSMDIVMNYGTLSISSGQNVMLNPGSRMIIKKDATLKIPSGVKFYVWDVAQWNLGEPSAKYAWSSLYQPDRATNPRSGILTDKTNLPSGEIFVQGTLEVSGDIQTTGGGAYIHSTNEDAGQVVFKTSATATGTVYQYTSGKNYTASSTTSAKLQNGDGTYEATAGSANGDKWIYRDGKWVKVSTDGCFVVETISGTPHYYAHPKDWVEVTANSPDDHAYHVTADPTRFVIQGKDCNWIEVVPADGYYKCINENSIYYNSYFEWSESNGYWVEKFLTIKFNNQGTVTTYSNIPYKSRPFYQGTTPTKTSSDANYYYVWTGWDTSSSNTGAAEYGKLEGDLPEATGDVTYYAHFDQKYYQYNITFKNDDGTVLDSRNWNKGTTPSYEGTPTKNPTAAETYEFNGTWTPAIATVTASATYVANYTNHPRAYTITFLNYDMSVLGTAEVVYNNTPSNATYLAAVAPLTEDPYKPDNSAYSFEFAGWRLQGASSNGFAQVKGDQTYVAQFNQTTKKYKISFVDDDGETVLHYLQLEYGATPSYTWEDPANKQDVEWNYTFTGWDPSEFATVESAQTYTAVYNKTKRKYDITWKDGNGNTLKTDQVAYGETPEYSGATPTKTATAQYTYTFNNTWSPAITSVTGDATYTAQFGSTVNKYTITWVDGNGETLKTEQVAYGQTPAYTGATPTKTATAQYTYTFNNTWSPAIVAVTEAATYTAQFGSTVNEYTITWVDGNGETLKTEQVAYGTTPAYTGATPTKTATAQYTYTFNNTWSPAIVAVTEAATYTAQFGSTINQYTLTVATNNAEWGTVTGGGLYDYNSAHTITATPKAGFKFVEWDDHNTNASRNVTVTADVTYTATFDYDIANYTVKHWQQNIDNDEYTEVVADRQTDLSGTIGTATAAEAKNYTGFTLKSPIAQQTIAQSGTVVNIYYDRITYTIIWDVKLSTVTESIIHEEETLRYGATPSYGEDPTYGPTDSHVYSFSGWTPTPYAVDKDQTYNGSFNVSSRPYTITFVNDNNTTVLQSSDFGWGSTPSYDYELNGTPESSHTGDGYTYTFAGWKNNNGNKYAPDAILPVVEGEATYTAIYNRSATAITVNTQEIVTINTSAPSTTVENGGELTIGDENNQTTLHSDTTIVVNGGQLIVAAGSSISGDNSSAESIIIVEAGGQLDVTEGATIEADVFIIQATTEEQGIAEAREEVQVSGELVSTETGSQSLSAIYYDLTRKHGAENFLARVWYAVAVPWAVEVPTYNNGGVYIKRGDEFVQQRLGATFDLLSYDGECRAQNGADADCWVYLENEIAANTAPAVMVPGKLYMIYLTEETSTIRFKKKAGLDSPIHTNSLTVSAHTETSNANDANWNGIANPATYRAYMNVNVGEGGLVQKFVPGTQPRDPGSYLPLNLADQQAVGQPFFVQIDPDAEPTVVAHHHTPNQSAPAPRRAQVSEDKEARYAIGIAANGKLTDRLYIQTAEEKEDKYVIGQDMSKMGISNYVAQMWVARYDSKLCLNTVAMARDKAVYPLGIYAPQAGEYMIFAPTDMEPGDNIYLTKDGRVIWNLTMAPYYATLEQGTTTNYGLRLIRSNAPAVTTGVDEVQSENAQCTKVIMDDHVYILRGEEIYTITGQKAK